METTIPTLAELMAAVKGASDAKTQANQQSNQQPQPTPKPESENDLLDETEAAEVLTIAPGTLSVWRSTGRYEIEFIKVGRRVRYKRGALLKWLDSRTRANGATA
jgi:hypothetical protein